MIGNNPEIKPSPKTESRNRIIPIVDNLLFVLEEYFSQVKSIYVFPANNGSLMTNKSFRCFWDRILKKMNLSAIGESKQVALDIRVFASDITPHIFRHTYATTLYYAGIDIKTAQYLRGHANAKMTMDIYTHLQLERMDSPTEKLNQYLSGAKEQKSNNS